MSSLPHRGVLALAVLLIGAMAGLAWWISAPAPRAVEVPSEYRPAAPDPSPATLEAVREPVPRAAPAESIAPPVDVPPAQASTPASPELSDRIAGQVVHRDGSPAREGTIVFAGDPGEHPPGRSDGEGRFVLSGLQPGASYFLSAAGHGRISMPSSAPILSGTLDAKVEVALLFGIAVVLREAGGGPLRSEVAQGDPTSSTTQRATPYAGGPFLAFVGAELSPYTDAPGRALFLFTAPVVPEPATIDRVPLRFRYLGYEPVEVGFDALPLLPAIPERTVELKPAVAEFGEIEVRFDGAPDPTIDGPREKPIRLQIFSSAGLHADIPLPRNEGSKLLGGIPHARYRVSVLNALDQQIHPKSGTAVRPVIVGATPAVVDVSLAGTTELSIEVRRADDQPYQGRGVFSLALGRPTPDGKEFVGRMVSVVFDSPPYRLAGLLPGNYALSVLQPAGAVVESAYPNGFFTLEPGATKTVTLELP